MFRPNECTTFTNSKKRSSWTSRLGYISSLVELARIWLFIAAKQTKREEEHDHYKLRSSNFIDNLVQFCYAKLEVKMWSLLLCNSIYTLTYRSSESAVSMEVEDLESPRPNATSSMLWPMRRYLPPASTNAGQGR